ncbi:MAG: polyphosphate polymerase domain-containing protein [Clostridiales bacterium]|nr:polyphosphate polymerase domain-containing protein [Clostridiales bacterium]
MAEIQHSFQRYEKKFLLTPAQYESIRPVLMERMEEEVYGLHTVCNIYYDTPSYELIRTSIEAPVYKEKFRLRSYGVPTDGDYIYAEIKKKYAGTVYKRRVEGHPGEIREFLEGRHFFSHDRQIQREIRWFLHSYQPMPKVFIGYERNAFLGRKERDLRVTFDRNLRWRREKLELTQGDEGEPILPDGRIVMEVKMAQAMPLWLSALLSENRIYHASFSKYGVCYRLHLAADFRNRIQGKAFMNSGSVQAAWQDDFTFQRGGETDVKQYYDGSNHDAAAACVSGNCDGARCADRHGIFI